MKRLNVFFFCLLALMSLAGHAQEKQGDANGYIVKVGDQAPDFTVELTDGQSVKLSSGHASVYGQLVRCVPQGDAVHREGHLAEA